MIANRERACNLEGDGLDLADLGHELGRVDGLLLDGVGVGHAVLVLDAVLAAGRDVLVGRVDVVEDACAARESFESWPGKLAETAGRMCVDVSHRNGHENYG